MPKSGMQWAMTAALALAVAMAMTPAQAQDADVVVVEQDYQVGSVPPDESCIENAQQLNLGTEVVDWPSYGEGDERESWDTYQYLSWCGYAFRDWQDDNADNPHWFEERRNNTPEWRTNRGKGISPRYHERMPNWHEEHELDHPWHYRHDFNYPADMQAVYEPDWPEPIYRYGEQQTFISDSKTNRGKGLRRIDTRIYYNMLTPPPFGDYHTPLRGERDSIESAEPREH